MLTPRIKPIKGQAQEIPFAFNQDKALYLEIWESILDFTVNLPDSLQEVILSKVPVRSAWH